MKRLRLLSVLTASLLTISAYAAQYGSETRVVITGTFQIAKPDDVRELRSGAVRVRRDSLERTVNNRTVLNAMVKENLIPRATGYEIVMVAQPNMADGVQFFAVRDGATPVRIPEDLFTLDVQDGPGTGVIEEDNQGRLTRVEAQTTNFATLSFGNFLGSGILKQSWSLETVSTDQVQLVRSSGSFVGQLSTNRDGVGTVELKLNRPKTVNLARYGMASSSGDSGGGGGGSNGDGVGSIGGGGGIGTIPGPGFGR